VRIKNWILYSGIGCLLLGSLILYFFDGEYVNSRQDINGAFLTLLLFGIIIAPVFEEIAFRGYFSKIKKLQILSLVILLLYVIIFFNIINLSLFLLFLLLLIINKGKENNFIFIVSTIFFGVMHYNVSDFTSLLAFNSIFFQIGFGAILLWIVINFNLKRAILLHSLINLTTFTFSYFYIINETDFSQKRIENKEIYVEWKKEFNFLPKRQEITISKTSFEAKNYDALKIYRAIQPLDKKQKQLFAKEPFISYTINFQLKDSINANSGLDLDELAEQYLKFSIEHNILAPK
jgi:glucan phosphoethanolaminetransferase (alkaline phosphatase superfamily)